MNTHLIITRELAGNWWSARCTCGAWRSKRYGYPGFAQRDGAAHVRAKAGT
jgi:hypothetical protein